MGSELDRAIETLTERERLQRAEVEARRAQAIARGAQGARVLQEFIAEMQRLGYPGDETVTISRYPDDNVIRGWQTTGGFVTSDGNLWKVEHYRGANWSRLGSLTEVESFPDAEGMAALLAPTLRTARAEPRPTRRRSRDSRDPQPAPFEDRFLSFFEQDLTGLWLGTIVLLAVFTATAVVLLT